jgi:hypothetical protein
MAGPFLRRFGMVFLHGILPLVAGGAIYLYFRRGSIVSQRLQQTAGIRPYRTEAPFWQTVWNVLPDFLWAYSLASVLFLYGHWAKLPSRVIFWLTAVFLTIAEAGQALPGSPFTFDIRDLIATAIAFFLSSWIHYRPFTRKQPETAWH